MTISIEPHHNSGPSGGRYQPVPPGLGAHEYPDAAVLPTGAPAPHFRRPYDSGLRRVPAIDQGYFIRQSLITAALVATTMYYGSWRVAMFGALGLVAKAYVVIEILLALVIVGAAVAMAKRTRPTSPPTRADLSLDVVIPVARQSVQVVENAVDSVLRLGWAHRLVVCNDGPGADGDNWRTIRSACHQRGIRCLTRFADAPDQAATLNHALTTLSGDIVMVVEPHRAIAPDAAERMIGWFGDPTIAFVCGPDQTVPGSRDPIAPTDAIFAKSWEPSRDVHGLAFATGAAMYRRSYLDDIGGFVAGSNPALLTSRRFHTYGYHSVYEHEPIATALGPTSTGEVLLSLRRWAIDARTIRRFPPAPADVSRRVQMTYRLASMYFPSLILVALATLGPAARIFAKEPFYVTSSGRELALHALPWAIAITATVFSWGGVLGGLRWVRSALFAQPAMAISGLTSGQGGYGSRYDRARQVLPDPGRLLMMASVIPGVLLASVVFGLVDSRPGGSAIAIAIASALLVVGGGPLLHGASRGFPFLRWSMYLFCLATGAAAVATAYFSWPPPDGILASVDPSPTVVDTDSSDYGFSDSAQSNPQTATADGAGTTDGENAPTTPAKIGLGGTPSPGAASTGPVTAQGAGVALPPDIAPPATGPVDHAGTLVAGDGIYVGITAADPPYDWDDVGTWPTEALHPQILHWYQSWTTEPAQFRNDLITAAHSANMTPLISWQAWVRPQGLSVATANQPEFSLQRVIAGDYDAYIDSWASSAAAYELPILLRPFQDPNGSWYPWSIGVNTNTAKQYRQAWRRVVERFQAAGADNVGFVWSITPLQGAGGADQLDAYYPGDDFVDWVGVSGFVWDDYGSWAEAADIPSVFAPSYAALETRDKPIMFIDVGATRGPDAPPSWVGDAMRYFSGLAKLRAVVWFDRRWDDRLDFTLTAEQRNDLAAAVAEVDATVAQGGPAAEGLSRFMPQLIIGPGSTGDK